MSESDQAVTSSPGPSREDVAAHYRVPGLLDAIRAGLAAMGKGPDTVTPDDLAPIEEFHIGGRPATKEVLDQLGLEPGQHVLDIGCGIGGPARFAAHAYGQRVTGIDVTPDYIEIGQTLSRWVGLADRVTLQQGSATDLTFAPATFDAAYMLHVGMNIADKEALCREAARVLKPGALFAVYDVMRLNDQPLKFPVPWAAHAGLSSVAPPSAYRGALKAAGFAVIAERNRRDFAITFFENLRAKQAAAAPPPLALIQIMGPDAPLKISNLLENLKAGIVGPCEIIARKKAG